MAVRIKRMHLDLVARDYGTNKPKWSIVSGSVKPSSPQQDTDCVRWEKEKAFTLRCYLGLEGEDSPVPTRTPFSPETSGAGEEQISYRYEWAFGIALIEKFYWDWMKELPEESALAIQLVLRPEPFEDGPGATPVAAILNTLHPSRNTKSIWEQALPLVPKTAAEVAKTGAPVFPLLDYFSSGLTLGSNVLASYTDNKKNWFLYQFFDEKEKCPVVEWRINKKVLVEYGPLIRGTLFLAFHRSVSAKPGAVRIILRPQIRYCRQDEICFIVPTREISPDDQVFIDVRPAEGKEAGV
jgi:hypothetical protein